MLSQPVRRTVAALLIIVVATAALVMVPVPASVPIIGGNSEQADADKRWVCWWVTKYKTETRYRWIALPGQAARRVSYTVRVPYRVLECTFSQFNHVHVQTVSASQE